MPDHPTSSKEDQTDISVIIAEKHRVCSAMYSSLNGNIPRKVAAGLTPVPLQHCCKKQVKVFSRVDYTQDKVTSETYMYMHGLKFANLNDLKMSWTKKC